MGLAEKIEAAMRKGMESLPEYKTAAEWEWCQAVAEAAEAIKYGAEMRASELEGGD